MESAPELDSDYRRLSKRQKAARWTTFHDERARKAAQRPRKAVVRGAPTRRKAHGFFSMNTMQTMSTPPPIMLLAAPSTAGESPSPAPEPLVPPLSEAAQVVPKLTWMQPSDWQRLEPSDRRLTADRVAAAGISSDLVGSSGVCDQKALSKKVLRRELSKEDAQRQREADARRKRVRRIQVEKEDRDALRELASSRSDGTQLKLEPTPAGQRETAIDGTPRSAKAAGAKLRMLTRTFYERLADPRFYGVTEEEFRTLPVKAKIWDDDSLEPGCWATKVRRLMRFGGGIGKNHEHYYCDDAGEVIGMGGFD